MEGMVKVVLNLVSKRTGFYLVIGGRTKEGALASAKAANRTLRQKFPGATLSTPRYLGFCPESNLERFEIGVLGNPAGCQAFLESMVLQGTVP